MPDYFQVPVAEVYHSDLYPEHQQDRFKNGYVAVRNQGKRTTQETAKNTVRTLLLQGYALVISWEDENWTGKNGWKLVENSLTVL